MQTDKVPHPTSYFSNATSRFPEPFDLIENIAELLYERIQLGKPARPVPDDLKKPWEQQFKTYLKHIPADEALIRKTSSSYYALLYQLLRAWQWVDAQQQDKDSQRLSRLDAFFDLMEQKLLEVEKFSTRQRILYKTNRGLFILGTRPSLARMTTREERTPFDVDRLYRRFSLLTNSPVDPAREIIDGTHYPNSMQRLNGVGLTIGLAALSGSVTTYFKPTNQLSDIGSNARIGFVSETMQPNNAYVQELQDCIDWAIEQGIHILCLPELSVCLDGRQVLKDHLKRRNGEKPLEHLALVVAGSYHVNDYNEAPVWLVGFNGEVSEFMYRKREALETRLPSGKAAPVSLQSLVTFAQGRSLTNCYMREDIASDDSILLLNLPVGLVAVIICKDFLNPDYYARYNAFEPDYLLIVSMNTKSGEFMQTWRKYPRRHALTAGFYVNATQVVSPTDNGTEVAFWGLPDDQDNAQNPKERKSRVYFRQPNSTQNNYEQLPEHGRVRVPPLPLFPVDDETDFPTRPVGYDTASFLPRIGFN